MTRLGAARADMGAPGIPSNRAWQTLRMAPWLALAALVILAIVLRHMVAASTDIGWLLTVGERVLAGERLYADVIETNPPMAVFAYLPGIVLARALGGAAETVVDGLVFAGIFAALAMSAHILARGAVFARGQGWSLTLLSFAILAVLPTQTFGQREHIALIALLPMLALLAVRTRGSTPSLGSAIVAGIGAAVALSFKPHFALGLFCALVMAIFVTRSLRRILLAPECLTIAAAMVLYLGVIILLFPEFFTVIGPLVRDVYLPVRRSFSDMLAMPALSLGAIASLAALALKQRSRIDSLLGLMLATSLGFAVVYLLQGKGWPYQSYPMIALALMAFGYAIMSVTPTTAASRAFRIAAVLLWAALFARAMLWFDVAFDARPLQERIAQLGPHPAILAISAEPGIGHPLVRAVGGTWVSRQQALWVATYLQVMHDRGMLDPARSQVLDAYATREREMLIADIRRTPPTVVLVDNLTGTGSAWLKAHPDVADLLKDFRLTDTVNHVAILTRRDQPAGQRG